MEKIFKLFKHRNRYKETIINWFRFIFVSAVYFSDIPSCIIIYFSIKKVLILKKIIYIKSFLTKNRTARAFGIMRGSCVCFLHRHTPQQKCNKKRKPLKYKNIHYFNVKNYRLEYFQKF